MRAVIFRMCCRTTGTHGSDLEPGINQLLQRGACRGVVEPVEVVEGIVRPGFDLAQTANGLISLGSSDRQTVLSIGDELSRVQWDDRVVKIDWLDGRATAGERQGRD